MSPDAGPGAVSTATAAGPELFIHEAGAAGPGTRIWPPSASRPGLVQETRAYVIELRGHADAGRADLLIDGESVDALRSERPDVGRWRWSPGFYAGGIGFEIRLPGGRRLRGECVTDPDRRKLTRDEFDAMVRDIVADTFALFSLSSFRSGFARGSGRDVPPIARLEFIASRVAEIEQAVQAIARQPVRVLRGREVWVPTDRARAVTARELLRSVRSRRLIPVDPASSPAAQALGGYLPDEVLKTVSLEALDIREHRDIRAALRTWAAWLTAKAALLAGGATDGVRDPDVLRARAAWARRCRTLAGRLSRLLELPLFATVRDQRAPMVLTSVYRRNPSYRRFYRLYRDMQLGIARLSGDHLQLPLSRTFDLYELWAFLRLLRAAAVRFGVHTLDPGALLEGPPDRSGLVLSARGASVEVTPGFVLHFQRQYEEFWRADDQSGSYSRPMRPDVSVAVQPAPGTPPRLIVLDAKYRIDEGLNDALASIHMYRDALVGTAPAGKLRALVIAAYLVSPQTPTFHQRWPDAAMPGRLFHPEYRSAFRFGAVSLRPGRPMQDAIAVVEAIASDAGVPLPQRPPSGHSDPEPVGLAQ